MLPSGEGRFSDNYVLPAIKAVIKFKFKFKFKLNNIQATKISELLATIFKQQNIRTVRNNISRTSALNMLF